MTKLEKLCAFGLEGGRGPLDDGEQRFLTVRNRVIEHPVFTMAVGSIARLHERWVVTNVAGALLIYGQSGTGKSTALDYYLKKFPRQVTPRRTTIPVLKVVTPEAPTVRSFTESILVSFGDAAASRGSAAIKTQRIIHFVKQCGVELILIDEFQHFCDSTASERRRVTDWLKNLLNECNVPVVLFGLPRAISALNANEQLRRRFAAPVYYKEFGYHSPEEQGLFRSVLKHLREQIPFPRGLDISEPEIAMRFHYATNGLIDYVVKIIDEVIASAPVSRFAEFSYDSLQQAFRTQIWADVPDALNPFNPQVPPRRLDKPNEPFSIWDDPSVYTLSSRAAALQAKARSGT